MKLSFSVPKVVLLIAISLVVLLTLSLRFMGGFVQKLDILAYNPNPLLRHFAPTWRSLKKTIDIPYLVPGALSSSDVPAYKIILSRNDLRNLLDNLPNFPQENRLYEEFKGTVKAEFKFNDYSTQDAKIRFRGKSPNHWNALKKSWQIQLPKEAPLGDRTTLRFFIPEDRGWAQIFLWNEVRKKLGLITLEASLARLTINERDSGIYILIESWEESLFEKHRRQFGKIFSDKNIDTRGTQGDLFMPENGYRWYERGDPEEKGGDHYPELMYLLELTAYAPDDVFEREINSILNVDKFLKWIFVAALSGNFHPGNNRENMNLYLDPATGLFEPISVDANVTPIVQGIELADNRLANRILRINRYRKQFESTAQSYLIDESNLGNDLAVYDAWSKKLLREAYSDTTKVETSYEIARSIKRSRAVYEHNFRLLQKMLREANRLDVRFANESYPLTRSTGHQFSPDTYAPFRAISRTRNEFLREYPEFVAGKEPHIVILLPGIHSFPKTVIVPRGLTLIVREGTTLYFSSGTSLISYSPVSARGTAAQPVTFQPAPGHPSWGVFAVMHAGSNDFRNVKISDGSDANVNGIYFSGSFSIYGSDVLFENGSVTRSHADDGMHILQGKAVIKNSTFESAGSDAIDIDLAIGNESTFENNIFRDTVGDAMDLSFSRITIRANTVLGCGDKGISIGEASEPFIEKNTIIGCVYGIAVKDRSHALISHSYLIENKTGIGLFRKKPHFIEGGTATVSKSVLWGNGEEIAKDDFSAITIEQSMIEGKDIKNEQPDFKSILPRAALEFLSIK